MKLKRNMNIVFKVILGILVLLAIASGISKIILLPQEVSFFGKYGFSKVIIILFGLVQLLGGALMVISKTREIGSITVGITFLLSAILLIIENNIPGTIVTLFFVLLLGGITKLSNNKKIQ